MEILKICASGSRKRSFRLTWINPRTGLQCRVYYFTFERAMKRVEVLKKSGVRYMEIWKNDFENSRPFEMVFYCVNTDILDGFEQVL